jgi:hypothetical protein
MGLLVGKVQKVTLRMRKPTVLATGRELARDLLVAETAEDKFDLTHSISTGMNGGVFLD